MTVQLTNSVPTPNASFSIQISGFSSKETGMKNGVTSFPNGRADVPVTSVEAKDLKEYMIASNYYKEVMFVNLPADFDPEANIEVDPTSIVRNVNDETAYVEFQVTLSHVYTATGTFTQTITFTGFQKTKISTKVADGSLDGLNFLPSSVTTDNEVIKRQLSSSGLIKYLPEGSTVEANDITIDHVRDANDYKGSLVLDITIGHSKTWHNAKIVENQQFNGIKITGFLTREPTSWALEKTINDKPSFSGTYANSFSTNQIKNYVLDNIAKFATNPPPLTVDDIIINDADITRDNNNGTITFSMGLKQIYDPTTALLVDNSTFTLLPKATFKLTGFDTRNTHLNKDGRFVYDDIWPGSGIPPTLDDSIINEQYFIDAIVNRQEVIFAEAPVISKSNIKNFHLEKNIAEGKATITFNLDNSRPTAMAPFEITISNFTKKVTAVTNSGQFDYGIPDKANVMATSAWVMQTIKAHKNEMFVNLPPTFNVDTDVTIKNGSINTSTAGKAIFTLVLNHVYTATGTLEQEITITGFKANYLTTEVAKNSMLPNKLVGNIFASSLTLDNCDILKQAIAESGIVKNLATTGKLLPTDIRIDNIDSPNDLESETLGFTGGALNITFTVLNNKAWKEGLEQNCTFTTKAFGFKTRLPTSIITGVVSDPDFFGDKWVRQFTRDDILSYIVNNKEKFFVSPPEDLKKTDIEIEVGDEAQSGQIIIRKLKLNRYYNNKTGLLTTGDDVMTTKQIVLSGFIVNQVGNTSLNKDIEKNGIVAGESIFNSMFPGDKGFALDWFSTNSYQTREQQIVNYINETIANPGLANQILINPSLNGWNTHAVSAKIEHLTSGDDLDTKVTIIFNEWIEGGVGINGKEVNIAIRLRPTPSASSLQNVIEDSLSVALNSMSSLSQVDKEKKIKSIICEQLNQQLDNIPDACIPQHASGRYFEPNDLYSMVIVFNSDNSVMIKRLVLGNPDIGAIQFRAFTISIKTFASKNWVTYTVIGGLSTVLALVALTLVYVIIKASRKKKVDTEEFW